MNNAMRLMLWHFVQKYGERWGKINNVLKYETKMSIGGGKSLS